VIPIDGEGHSWPAVLGDQVPIPKEWADIISTTANAVMVELGDTCHLPRGPLQR
jgi:hypothetical protein